MRICVLCLIVVPLPPGKNSFSVQLNNNAFVQSRCLKYSENQIINLWEWYRSTISRKVRDFEYGSQPKPQIRTLGVIMNNFNQVHSLTNCYSKVSVVLGVRLDWVLLARRPLFKLLCQPRMMDDDDDDVFGVVGGILGRGNGSTRRKTAPVRLSFKGRTWTDLDSNPSRLGWKPVTNRLRHGTAVKSVLWLTSYASSRPLRFFKPKCTRTIANSHVVPTSACTKHMKVRRRKEINISTVRVHD
jgi:hypothetical protein